MESNNMNNFDVSRFGSCRVLVVGDVMIDQYVWGEVSRISPEAPVQVVEVKNESSTLGGAGNVVNNLIALGAGVSVAGIIGDGPAGADLQKMFAGLGVNTSGLIVEAGRATTRKTRVIAEGQQVLRIDRESKKHITKAQVEALCLLAEKQIPDLDLVLISDYGKGVVTQHLMERLLKICEQNNKILIVDPKGLNFSKYRGAFAITPNKKEAALASGVEISNSASLEKAANKLLEKLEVKNLLITCGKDGMALFGPDRPASRIHAQARQVFDVSGAGDTVLAVLGLSLAAKAPFGLAARLANTAAGIVVGKVGTATISQQELATALSDHPDSTSAKHKTLAQLVQVVDGLRRKGKKIVLTNGCFDLLHEGHIRLFSESRKLGDVLIVAVDDDESVHRLKGQGRPVIRQRERVRIISALNSVDFVNVFASSQLQNLIKAICPDVLTKGGNYSQDDVYGHELVEKLGGRVALIPVAGNVSSSRIIKKIQDNAASD